jgi:hypothetical protein
MEITKEQVLDIYDNNFYVDQKLQEWFPEAFKVELEVGMVIKRINSDTEWIIKVCENYRLYGINTNGNYFDLIKDKETIELILNNEENKKATTQEWHAALIEEAKKRGYKNGNYECLYMPHKTEETDEKIFFESGEIWIGFGSKSNMIFKDGVWTDIIKTFSKEEAEKLLGGKII